MPHEPDHSTPVDIQRRLEDLQSSISECELKANRAPGSVSLLAVSKTKPVELIQAAYAAGQRRFGENYAQELESKAQALAELKIEWHFIGPLQSNKTKLVASYADWVHSIDRFKLAQRLSDQRPANLPPVQLCLQVNIDNEPSKAGASIEKLPELAQAMMKLPNVQLRGLMCIPKPHQDPIEQREPFARLREALEQLNKQGLELDTLSMGMSGDYAEAITQGATIIRVGTAIFGARR